MTATNYIITFYPDKKYNVMKCITLHLTSMYDVLTHFFIYKLLLNFQKCFFKLFNDSKPIFYTFSFYCITRTTFFHDSYRLLLLFSILYIFHRSWSCWTCTRPPTNTREFLNRSSGKSKRSCSVVEGPTPFRSSRANLWWIPSSCTL